MRQFDHNKNNDKCTRKSKIYNSTPVLEEARMNKLQLNDIDQGTS
jgi:hypothetical protein